MKVIIAGSRDFTDDEQLRAAIADAGFEILAVISGGARGVDALGEKWAEENGIPVKVFPADWDLHGKAAGPIRNREMAEAADALIALWDGESRGTKNMINTARKKGLKTHIHRTDQTRTDRPKPETHVYKTFHQPRPNRKQRRRGW